MTTPSPSSDRAIRPQKKPQGMAIPDHMMATRLILNAAQFPSAWPANGSFTLRLIVLWVNNIDVKVCLEFHHDLPELLFRVLECYRWDLGTLFGFASRLNGPVCTAECRAICQEESLFVTFP